MDWKLVVLVGSVGLLAIVTHVILGWCEEKEEKEEKFG
jgi:hypothetical protein